jgi:hypothetical protein
MVLSQRSYRLYQRTDILTYTGYRSAAALTAALASQVTANTAAEAF